MDLWKPTSSIGLLLPGRPTVLFVLHARWRERPLADGTPYRHQPYADGSTSSYTHRSGGMPIRKPPKPLSTSPAAPWSARRTGCVPWRRGRRPGR